MPSVRSPRAGQRSRRNRPPATADAIVEVLVAALGERDYETREHSRRVAEMTMRMASALGMRPSSREWRVLERAATLHDVGKIWVSDDVLLKPSALLPHEWAEMRQHPMFGSAMIEDVETLVPASVIVRAHHERWDGGGYPQGLCGEDIPLGARIFALADAFDAMTSMRPYRDPYTPEHARQEIAAHRGTQFEPRMVDVFESCYEGLTELTERRAA